LLHEGKPRIPGTGWRKWSPARETGNERSKASKDSFDTIRRAAEGDGTKPGRISPDDLKIMHRVTADQRASGFQARMP